MNWGMLYPDLSPRPSYVAYAVMAKLLSGTERWIGTFPKVPGLLVEGAYE